MLLGVKACLAKIFERHPLAYSVAVRVMNHTDLFLPHEPDYLAFPLLSRVFDGGFLDVGGNQGHSARGFYKLVKGRKIYSIEGNDYHRSALERVQRNVVDYTYYLRAADRVSGRKVEFFTPVYKGIVCHSAAAMTLEDAESAIQNTWPRQFAGFRFEKSVSETIAIDDLDLSLAVIKMDIQGNEMAALQGCRETIQRCRPAFLVEIVTHLDTIKAFFLSIGYKPFNFDPTCAQMTPMMIRPTSRNVFFLPAERCGDILAAAASLSAAA